MKKISLLVCLVLLYACCVCHIAYSASSSFSYSLKSCQKYSKSADITRNGETYNMTITLDNKGNNCIYKEHVSQGPDFATLTCTFPKDALSFLSSTMEKYNDDFKVQIQKEPIFEAKMTNNNIIFQKYLADPHYCKITNSNKANLRN